MTEAHSVCGLIQERQTETGFPKEYEHGMFSAKSFDTSQNLHWNKEMVKWLSLLARLGTL